MKEVQIIDRDPNIKRLLGTTKQISSANSKDFKKAIGKYIDSKEKKRGNKDDKDKKKKDKEKSDGPAVSSNAQALCLHLYLHDH